MKNSTIRNGKNESNYLIVALFVSLTIGLMAFLSGVEPLTDFLRHIREYEYRSLGGYAFMFPDSLFSDLNGYNPYYLFDTLIGWFSTVVGRHWATSVIEALSFTLYSFAVYRNAKSDESNAKHAILILPFVVAFIWAMFFRAVQIRPAMFVSVIFYFMLPSRSFVAGFIGSVLSASLYWLYFLFTIPLAIGHWFSGSRRTSYGILSGSLVSIIVLTLSSGGENLVAIKKVFGVMGTSPLLIAPEMKLPLSLLLAPETAVIFFAFGFSVYKRRQMNVYLSTLICSLPLFVQERFAHDLCIPLMLFYVMHSWSDEIRCLLSTRITPKVVVACLFVAFFMIGLPFGDQMRIQSGQVKWTRHLDLPTGTKVFSDQAFYIYPVIYENPRPIQIYPPLETTFANDKNSESVVGKIVKYGVINNEECEYFAKHNIDYVISAAKVSAACLVEANKEKTAKDLLKMWKVRSL